MSEDERAPVGSKYSIYYDEKRMAVSKCFSSRLDKPFAEKQEP
jgi:hypothetical protein